MKTAIVPAQITTVEDKVTGSLSLSQLLLLAAPVFGGTAIYTLFPPALSTTALKIVLISVFTVACGLFAIRIKGQILLFWAIVLFRYNSRPRYHLFNKNDLHLRPIPKALPEQATAKKEIPVEHKVVPESQLELSDVIKLEQLIAHPEAKFHFVTDRKGDLSVRITEVK